MNPQPAPYDWWTCASVITLELFVFFVAAKLASRRVASAARQRNLWQITLLAMLLVLIGELNGVRGWLRWPEMEGKFPPSHTALVTTWNPESVEFIVPFAGFAAVTTVPGATPQTATESDSPRPRVPWLAIGLLGITALLLFRMAVAQPLTIAFRMPARRWPESNLAQLAQRLAVKM
ncbi:MAG TPA: hypothetical protein VK846_19820, partial [Candidatus Limnocylindria bacterium]|nr:hypothetical protein [Candidatus Limnocylindria bacterium]